MGLAPWPLGAGLVGLAGLVAALGGCSAEDRTCPAPRAVSDPGLLVRSLGLDRVGTTTAADDRSGLSTATIVSSRSVGDLLPLMRARLSRDGYESLGEDDEGFEAEIYVARGNEVYGVVRLREDQSCEGRTSIQLSVATKAAPTATATPP